MTDPEIEIFETEVRAPPAGTPPDFRERVTLRLKTTDMTVLDAAEQDYRGVFETINEFIRTRLPANAQWIFACCDRGRLQEAYELEFEIVIWTIPLPRERMLVFESQRRPAGIR
jgi:hypothetical protein